MGINIFDRQFFGDLTQFDTTQTVDVSIAEGTISVGDVSTRQILLKRSLISPEDNDIFDAQFFGNITDQFDTKNILGEIGDSLSRALILKRTVTDPAVVVGTDVISRVLSLARTILDTTVISDLSTRVIVLKRKIDDSAVVGIEILVRTLGLKRAMTDPTTVISDVATRIIKFARSISDTVTIIDSIIRGLFTPPKVQFMSKIKESLSFGSRIKETEDVSI
ncbi:hypothetical protein LCGC14_1254440 [marine sediment metagenome]|uniref:Uncharacterized protein n=1 Tax=marine sediment metagenome TaxID=412755 RepID=A0A0F9NJ57_9ZZZZ